MSHNICYVNPDDRLALHKYFLESVLSKQYFEFLFSVQEHVPYCFMYISHITTNVLDNDYVVKVCNYFYHNVSHFRDRFKRDTL